jgi:hypothetical protein
MLTIMEMDLIRKFPMAYSVMKPEEFLYNDWDIIRFLRDFGYLTYDTKVHGYILSNMGIAEWMRLRG